MECDEARPLLDAYVDGQLELTRQLGIETHLADCASCKNEAAQITNQNLLLRMNMPVHKAPPELRSKIRATLRKEAKGSLQPDIRVHSPAGLRGRSHCYKLRSRLDVAHTFPGQRQAANFGGHLEPLPIADGFSSGRSCFQRSAYCQAMV